MHRSCQDITNVSLVRGVCLARRSPRLSRSSLQISPVAVISRPGQFQSCYFCLGLLRLFILMKRGFKPRLKRSKSIDGFLFRAPSAASFGGDGPCETRLRDLVDIPLILYVSMQASLAVSEWNMPNCEISRKCCGGRPLLLRAPPSAAPPTTLRACWAWTNRPSARMRRRTAASGWSHTRARGCTWWWREGSPTVPCRREREREREGGREGWRGREYPSTWQRVCVSIKVAAESDSVPSLSS